MSRGRRGTSTPGLPRPSSSPASPMTFSARLSRGLLLALLLPVATACDGDLLDVDPTEQVGPDIATGTQAGVEALLAGVYNRMQNEEQYGSVMLLVPEILADDGRPSDPPINFQAEYLNQPGDHIEGWGFRYETINEANFVIASASSDELDAPQAVKDRLRGEALFLRALNYHDLARVFAYEPNRAVGGWDRGVVLRTEPTRTVEDAEPRARSSVVETYQQIESDLLQAIDLLAASGGDDVFYATQAAAEALLARVYLYWQRWDDAAIYATRALENTSARLADPSEYRSMWEQVPNPESVWEINYDPATETLWVNNCMACYTHPDGTWFSIWPSRELLELFEPEDARWAVYPETEAGIPYTRKWTESRGDNTDNTPVLRYSELLLIRAEARAESGDEEGARQDLATLRASRNLGPVPAGGDALIQAVLDERRRELGFEGHRWFDLKRRGLNVPKPAHSGLPPLPYSDFRILAPIPSDQVENNPELEQNPGY